MATEIKLPRLGQGMDEGKILRWLKQEGDAVAKGDEIYEVETEKVNIEVESPAAGTLLKIVVGEGQEVPIGTVLAYVGKKGEEVSDSSSAASTDTTQTQNGAASTSEGSGTPRGRSEGEVTEQASKTPDSKVEEARTVAQQTPSGSGAANDASDVSGDTSRVKASPLARRMAQDQRIDLSTLEGSGPDGRIIARDLEHLTGVSTSSVATPGASAGAAGAVERLELSSLQRTIVRRLGEAWQAPAFYLTTAIDMTQANDLRAQLVSRMRDGDVKPTVSDIITKACAVALRRHPDMNAHFAGDAILRFADIHIGIAAATDKGLVVPVVRDVHARSVREIAAARKDVVDRARAGKLGTADMEGATFTISNLGMMGIDQFTAVLNPPMAGILAVGQTVDTPVAINRKVEIRPHMNVTLGCDHRAVDGAAGAAFLQTLKGCLEEPLTMI